MVLVNFISFKSNFTIDPFNDKTFYRNTAQESNQTSDREEKDKVNLEKATSLFLVLSID